MGGHQVGEYAVEARALTKRFGNFTAVDAVSFEVRPGEIFAFLGPNGCGKSTTIRMLCGIIRPTSGIGRVLGHDLDREGAQLRHQLGYMSQKFSLYEELTARENLDFYAGVYGVQGAHYRRRLAVVLELTGLTALAERRAGQLSTGWRQRLALGCAILHEPQVLFLDEPTAGVDALSRRRFWDLIYQLASEGVTIFVTTHYMDEAEYADRVSLMRAGALIAVDSPARLKERLPTGTLWEIETDQPLAAIGVLMALPGVAEVTLHGTLLHVRALDRLTEPPLRSVLQEAGHRVGRVEPIPAALEDVFIALVGEPV